MEETQYLKNKTCALTWNTTTITPDSFSLTREKNDIRFHGRVFLRHLSARLKVWMGERAGPLQKLPHVIPPAVPVATTVPVTTIYCHSGHTTHKDTLNLY